MSRVSLVFVGEVSIHRAYALHWLAIHRARKRTIAILCSTISSLLLTMNNIVGEHFCEKTALGLVFSVRVRVSGSVSASVSFVVNIMFEIAGREVTR